ncbi:MAG: hypothetical protein R6U40_10810 [Desulfobacterales bacterium]
MIHAIQAPPFERIGVMDLESIYPARERFALAMRMNNLLASPGFESWMEGDPLNIGQMLYTPQGKSRASIFTISHLSDSERMFFVSMLLNEILGWMRTQPGTSSLCAILYMDEIFGYFPPVGNPPSKTPLLTLFKQARAFGLGVLFCRPRIRWTWIIKDLPIPVHDATFSGDIPPPIMLRVSYNFPRGAVS